MEQINEKQLRIDKVKPILRERIVSVDGVRPVSAQYFNGMGDDEREALKQVVEESGKNYDEYERKMKKLFPAETRRKGVWRKL